MTWRACVLLLCAVAGVLASGKSDDLDCMFLGYPELEYDGFDRTEVSPDTVQRLPAKCKPEAFLRVHSRYLILPAICLHVASFSIF